MIEDKVFQPASHSLPRTNSASPTIQLVDHRFVAAVDFFGLQDRGCVALHAREVPFPACSLVFVAESELSDPLKAQMSLLADLSLFHYRS